MLPVCIGSKLGEFRFFMLLERCSIPGLRGQTRKKEAGGSNWVEKGRLDCPSVKDCRFRFISFEVSVFGLVESTGGGRAGGWGSWTSEGRSGSSAGGAGSGSTLHAFFPPSHLFAGLFQSPRGPSPRSDLSLVTWEGVLGSPGSLKWWLLGRGETGGRGRLVGPCGPTG